MSQAMARSEVRIQGFSLLRPRLTPLILALVLVSLLSLMFVWSRIHAINLEYAVSGLERDIRLQEKQNEVLSTEVAMLGRDSRIERLARKHLHMREPASGQITRID